MAPHRPRRVVLTGSESTGKSTLAAWLGAELAVPVVPEFVRAYADDKGAPIDAADVEPIARGQLAAVEPEDAVLVVSDTDLLSTLVYARHYYGSSPAWIEAAVRDRRGDLYLLMDIDWPWVADDQRDRGDRREEMHALFRDALEEFGAHYVVIGGSWESRRIAALEEITKLLPE